MLKFKANNLHLPLRRHVSNPFHSWWSCTMGLGARGQQLLSNSYKEPHEKKSKVNQPALSSRLWQGLRPAVKENNEPPWLFRKGCSVCSSYLPGQVLTAQEPSLVLRPSLSYRHFPHSCGEQQCAWSNLWHCSCDKKQVSGKADKKKPKCLDPSILGTYREKTR